MDFVIPTGQMIDSPKPYYISHSGQPSSITYGTSCLVLVIATCQAIASVVKSAVFWDTMPCIPLKITRHFGGIYRIHLKVLIATCFHTGILLDLFFDLEDGGDNFLRNLC
jgi:hypothetical protein